MTKQVDIKILLKCQHHESQTKIENMEFQGDDGGYEAYYSFSHNCPVCGDFQGEALLLNVGGAESPQRVVDDVDAATESTEEAA